MKIIDLNTAPNHIKIDGGYSKNVTRISYDGKQKSDTRKTIKRKYADGDIYEGEIDSGNGKFDGQGTMIFDGNTFIGTFKDGIPVNGLYKRADGITYEGEVSDDYAPNGQGTMTFENGYKATGTFRDGVLITAVDLVIGGGLYTGDVDENFMPNGQGTMTYGDVKDCGIFKGGQFTSGKRDIYNPGNDIGKALRYKVNNLSRREEIGDFVNGILSKGEIKDEKNNILIKDGKMYHGQCDDFSYNDNVYNGTIDQGIFRGSLSSYNKMNVFNGTVVNSLPIEGSGSFISQSSMSNEEQQQLPATQVYNGNWSNGNFTGNITSYVAGIYNSETSVVSSFPQESNLYSQKGLMYKLNNYVKNGDNYNAQDMTENEFVGKYESNKKRRSNKAISIEAL